MWRPENIIQVASKSYKTRWWNHLTLYAITPPLSPLFITSLPRVLHLLFYWFTLRFHILASPHFLFSLHSPPSLSSSSSSSSSSSCYCCCCCSSSSCAQLPFVRLPHPPFHVDGWNWEEKAAHLDIPCWHIKILDNNPRKWLNPARDRCAKGQTSTKRSTFKVGPNESGREGTQSLGHWFLCCTKRFSNSISARFNSALQMGLLNFIKSW